MKRIISEEEPVRPSARVSSSQDQLEGLARVRLQDPGQLIRALRGDLDWIVLKALEKDRGRRYATAGDLIADLERLRSDEPVLASPPSVSYRTGKFLRRHRRSVAAAGAVLVTLLLGIVATSVAYLEARRERNFAQESAAIASREAEIHRAVADFLTEVLSSTAPSVRPGAKTVRTVDELLDAAAAQLESGRLAEHDANYARVAMTLANTYSEHWQEHKAADLAARVVRRLDDGSGAPLAFVDAVTLLVRLDATDREVVRRAGGVDLLRKRALELLEPGTLRRDPAVLHRLHEFALFSMAMTPDSAGLNERAARRLLIALDGLPDAPISPAAVELSLATAILWQGREDAAKAQYEIAANRLREHLVRADLESLVTIAIEAVSSADSQLFAEAMGRPAIVDWVDRIVNGAPRTHTTARAIESLCGTLLAIPSQGDDPYVVKPYRAVAIAALRTALAMRRESLGDDHPYIADNLFLTALFFDPREEYEQRVAAFENARHQWEETQPRGYCEVTGVLATTHLLKLLGEPPSDSRRELLGRAEELIDDALEWIDESAERKAIWALQSTEPAVGALLEIYEQWHRQSPDEGFGEREIEWRVRHRELVQKLVDRAHSPGTPTCAQHHVAQALLRLKSMNAEELEQARSSVELAVRRTQRRHPALLETWARVESRSGQLNRTVDL